MDNLIAAQNYLKCAIDLIMAESGASLVNVDALDMALDDIKELIETEKNF